MVLEVNENNFSEITSDGVVVLDFFATWCGPCRLLGSTLDKIAAERSDVKFGKCNIEDNPSLAEQFGVRNIPFVVYFKDGEAVDGIAGLQTEKQLLEKIDSLV